MEYLLIIYWLSIDYNKTRQVINQKQPCLSMPAGGPQGLAAGCSSSGLVAGHRL